MTSGQCNGMADAAYSGVGVNQNCAFKDAHYLWQDGSYANGNSFPAWGWIGKGGDTYLLRGSIGTGVSYRVGWNNASEAQDPSTNIYSGVAGDPYGSGIPAPPSGTAAAPTHILGENYANCTAQTARTQLHGGYGVYIVLDLRGASYVDVQCLDITDFSNCSLNGSATTPCNKSPGTLSDYAISGLAFLNTSTNITLSNVRAHGLAGNGFFGPTGTGAVFNHIELIGNSASGWNADPATTPETTGSGTLLVQNFNISWNGCTEEYPMTDALPYNQCADDSSGGYGDGFGTASLESNPGWQATFDQGVVSYNTQDGLDALHLYGPGAFMTISRVLAYGNMGQQIKIGGAAGTAQNNVIVTNCNALRQPIPGTPSGYNNQLSDFCRAADTGVAIAVAPGSVTKFDNNTLYTASATAIEIDCEYGVTCDSTTQIDYRNNIFVGFRNNPEDGYIGQWDTGTGDYSNPIFYSFNAFANPGSVFSNNITYHPKSNWTCPAAAVFGEINALCVDPQLTDETWHNYGYPNVEPTSASPALGKGLSISGITTDYLGQTRSSPSSIGAYQK